MTMSRRTQRCRVGTFLLIAGCLAGLELPAHGRHSPALIGPTKAGGTFGAAVPAPPASIQTQPQSLPNAIEQVDALVAAALAEDNIGGITIGIVSGGHLVWTQSYGYADVERRVPLTNPRQDIANIRRISAVVLAGTLRTRPELDVILKSRKDEFKQPLGFHRPQPCIDSLQ